jgi:4-amino-4-deoxy-L-arabinose transferase-like glycosyltransferase
MSAKSGLALRNRITHLRQRWYRLDVQRKDLLILVLLGLIAATIMFWRLGEGSLSDYDEADYAQSAREMLWLNDFNTPRWNGMEFFDKPPVCQWLTALAYKVFGINEFGARFVAASSGVLAILMTYVLGRDLFGKRAVGLGAAVVLLTVNRNLFSHSYNFVSLARVGMLDMPLILTLMLAVWLAWRSQRDPRCLIWLGVPLGLGLMIKSIAGFLAYGIVGLYFLVGLPRSAWWRKEMLWGFLLSLLVAAPWHVGQLLIWGRHFWDSYMVSLTVGYVTGEQGHTRDLLFYFGRMRRGFPVLYPLVAAAVAYGLYRAMRHHVSPAVQPGPIASPAQPSGDRAVILLLCWTAVPMVLYNVSRSRIGWYMIPIYPALALLTMNLLVTVLRSKLALLLVLVATLAFNPWLPRAGDFNPDVKTVASYSRYVLSEEAIVVNYWPGSYWIRPSALFYADRTLLLVTNDQALRRLLTTEGDFYVLADWTHWEPVQELGDVVYRSGEYVLVRAHHGVAGREGS